jgi:general secretion pathway protein A
LYLKYFGLREAPFNLTPDPKFFFDSPLHREAWASLFYGIKEKKGFVVVTGEVGTGKTTLLRKLLRNFEATHRSVFIFNTLLSFDELLEAILIDLDIGSVASGRIAMLQQLNEFLLDQVKQGHIVSVILDEAQNLGEDALEAVRLLSNMETDREKLIQIILAGQPELVEKLDGRSLRQLKQRISLWCRLECLGPADADAYIRHRLKVAGYEGPGLFDAATIPYIWQRTAGIPRLINAVCDSALLTAFATSQKTVSLEIVQEAIRDLRIEPGSQRLESLVPIRKDPAAPVRSSAGIGVAELREEKIRWPEESPRFGRNAPVTAAAEVIPHPLKRELEGNGIAASDFREFRRQQVRPVAGVAEAMERKNAAIASGVNIGEYPVASRSVLGNGNILAAQSRTLDDRRNETTVSPVFFDKMVASLTEAMGPMACLVIKEKAFRLGESLERFPIVKLPDLIKAIKSEILSDSMRVAFEDRIIKDIEQLTKLSGRRYSSR